jgi:photosystem II stability/assembly factor-like uncharacterized protein
LRILLPVFLIVLAFANELKGQIRTENLRFNPVQFHARQRYEDEWLRGNYLQKVTASDTIPLGLFDDFSTTDVAWTSSRNYYGSALHWLEFIRGDRFLARGLGESGLGIQTENGGSSWQQRIFTDSISILSAVFPEVESDGFACGRRNWIGKTPDGGQTWTETTKPRNKPTAYISLDFKNMNFGLVADSAGFLFRTGNGGSTWDSLSLGLARIKIRSLAWLSGDQWIAAGDSGRVALSSDNGSNWNVLQFPEASTRHFRKIKRINPSFAVAAGDSGIVYTWIGGVWRRGSVNGRYNLKDVDFNPENLRIGWAVGENGTILYTRNQGNNWTKVPSNIPENILCLDMVNEYRGWMGTENGRLLQLMIDPGRPASRFWEKNSGVYINQNYGVNPHTIGVASFDGLNQWGRPYSIVSNAVRFCDTLTSVGINLNGLQASGVNLTFYLQAGGPAIQTLPDPGDIFVVEFKDKNNEWVKAWEKSNTDTTGKATPFLYHAIAVPDSLCYNGFQFRFMNFGDPTGNFDLWNLDYVRLDNEHNASDSLAVDVAISKPPTRLLKDYRALPVEQFEFIRKNNLQQYFADAIFGEVSNLNPSFATPVVGSFRLKLEKESVTDVLESTSDFQGLELAFDRGITKKVLSKSTASLIGQIPEIKEKSTLRYGYTVGGQSQQTNLYLGNDSLESTFNISSVMAADDGSAELIRGGGNNLAKAAVRFFLPATDTITDIALYFPRTPLTFTQTIGFTLILYDSINVETNFEKPIFRLPVILPPSLDSLNQFDYFDLRIRPLNQRILQGGRHFFIGWQQPVIDNGNEVFLGCDINASNPKSFYYNDDGSDWSIWEKDSFAIMIRPVFGTAIKVGVQERITAPSSPFFPNPGPGVIRNHEHTKNLLVFNHMGQQVYEKDFLPAAEPLELNLKPGFYFLKWEETNGSRVSQKIIIQ